MPMRNVRVLGSIQTRKKQGRVNKTSRRWEVRMYGNKLYRTLHAPNTQTQPLAQFGLALNQSHSDY